MTDTKPRCMACSAPNAHAVGGWWWWGVAVELCERCEAEARSDRSEYEVRLRWVDEHTGYRVVRERRKRHAFTEA